MRLQLALNVTNLNEAIDFYSKLFGTEPYKVKTGYANWAIENPPLKLVIFEQADAEPGSINHLGVETDSADEVVEHEARLRDAGLTTTGIDDTICCFAEKVETWVNGPASLGVAGRWEWYVKQADTEERVNVTLKHLDTGIALGDQATCCAPAVVTTGSSGAADCC